MWQTFTTYVTEFWLIIGMILGLDAFIFTFQVLNIFIKETVSVGALQWAFGVLLWELYTRGELPYSKMDYSAVKSYLASGARLLQPSHAPDVM